MKLKINGELKSINTEQENLSLSIVINNNEANKLIIVRRLVELLKRLNAAPLFLTRVNFMKLGIIFIDFPNSNETNTKNLLI